MVLGSSGALRAGLRWEPGRKAELVRIGLGLGLGFGAIASDAAGSLTPDSAHFAYLYPISSRLQILGKNIC